MLGRRGRRRDCSTSSWTTGHGARSPTHASAPRTTTSAPRRAAWTRRSRCSAARATRSSSTSATRASRPVALPLDDAGLTLLVIDTRVSHSLTDGSYGDRRSECASAAEALGVDSLRETDLADVERLDDPVLRRRARHVVTENQRVLDVVAALDSGDWASLSATLDASHVSMRDDFEISCRELDLAVETARAAGALGARMTGGGFGGSAVALVPADAVSSVQDIVTSAFVTAG